MPGASQVIRGGLVVYATDLKSSLAGVDPELLARVGAVDPGVAAQLAVGVRDRLLATYGVGITGVAGPDEQDGRPVGEVHCAVAGPGSAAGDPAAVTLRSYAPLGPKGADVARPSDGSPGHIYETRRSAVRLILSRLS